MDDSSTSLYLKTCLLFIAGVVAGACAINDLSFVFGMIAAWNESMLNFVFPGLFFLSACRYTKQTGSYILKLFAVLFSLLGIVYFGVSNYYNWVKINKDAAK